MNMRKYRAIGIVDGNGKTISVMYVHESVSDMMIAGLMYQYEYETCLRLNELRDTGSISGREVKAYRQNELHPDKEMESDFNLTHRLNLLKKLVRLNPALNQTVRTELLIANGLVVDCKNWRKKDIESEIRDKRIVIGDITQCGVIETKDEIDAYTRFGAICKQEFLLPKIMFADVAEGDGKIKRVCLTSPKEVMIG